GRLTPGELVVFLAYLKRGFKPLQDFAKYTGRLSKAMAASDRIVELLRHQPEVIDRPDAVPAPALAGHVRFENVTFGYHPERKVLQSLSFAVDPGERIAIVGPSGAGKSTLFSLLLRLYEPSAGSILIDGQDVRHWTLSSVRGQLGVVLQDNAVFSGTVRENISLAVEHATDADIEHAAGIAMADEFINRLPDGYDTLLGERGVNLSQGQRQRLAIARAVLRQTPLLLLDEPTSSLDPANREKVLAALRSSAEGRTCFVITHDVRVAAECDRILFLDGRGESMAGSHEELFHCCAAYAAWCLSDDILPVNVSPAGTAV
ncbi:MAG: ABC transporter ATP-binding protein, partial [Planctomycetaceae bacterium]|nr:ABC transporter ATP-binding protein [Planctomycetaceae bacterium]